MMDWKRHAAPKPPQNEFADAFGSHFSIIILLTQNMLYSCSITLPLLKCKVSAQMKVTDVQTMMYLGKLKVDDPITVLRTCGMYSVFQIAPALDLGAGRRGQSWQPVGDVHQTIVFRAP